MAMDMNSVLGSSDPPNIRQWKIIVTKRTNLEEMYIRATLTPFMIPTLWPKFWLYLGENKWGGQHKGNLFVSEGSRGIRQARVLVGFSGIGLLVCSVNNVLRGC